MNKDSIQTFEKSLDYFLSKNSNLGIREAILQILSYKGFDYEYFNKYFDTNCIEYELDLPFGYLEFRFHSAI